jgi:hypothetical protein
MAVFMYRDIHTIQPYIIILHSHPEIEISFKFIPKILMSKECIHFFGPLCISVGLTGCIEPGMLLAPHPCTAFPYTFLPSLKSVRDR